MSVNIKTHEHKDAGIAAAILNGDVERYAELISEYQPVIYSAVARRIPDNDIAAVAHEVFVQAYKSLHGYSGQVPFGNWAMRIAIRTCAAYWKQRTRQNNRQVSLQENEEQRQWLEQIPSRHAEDAADFAVNSQDTEKVLQWVLGELAPEDRTLIESVYFDNILLKDVAEALGWSMVKSKVRALRARRKMRRLLESLGE